MSVSATSSIEAQIAARTLALQGAASSATQGQAAPSTSDRAGTAPVAAPTSSTQVDLSPGATSASSPGSSAAVSRLADKYAANGIDSDGAGLLALQLQQQLSQSTHQLANAAPQMILNLFKS